MISSIQTSESSPLKPSANGPLNRAAFNLSQRVLDTYRLADISPLAVYNGLVGDKVSINIKPTLNSFSLAAPLLSNLVCHTAAFSVPMASIMPNNYDIFKVPPKVGSDVPTSLAPCYNLKSICNGLTSKLRSAGSFYDSYAQYDPAPTSTSDSVQLSCVRGIINMLQALNDVLADDSVLHRCGVSPYSHVTYNRNSSNNRLNSGLQQTLEYINTVFANYSLGEQITFSASDKRSIMDDLLVFLPYAFKELSFTLSNQRTYELFTYDSQLSKDVGTFNRSVFREFLEDVRDNTISSAQWEYSTYYCEFASDSGLERSFMYNFVEWWYGLYTALYWESSIATDRVNALNCSDINMTSVFAYQMACAEFFTNDSLDEVCTARKYLARLSEYARLVGGESEYITLPYFELNSQTRVYDVCSYGFFDYFIDNFTALDVSSGSVMTMFNYQFNNALYFLRGIFGTNRSLVYENYYLSSKTQPLSTGAVDPSVAGSSFDVFKQVLVTKYLNAVNRMPQKVRDFVKSMFGVDGAILEPQPAFLGHYSQNVGSSQAVGTAADNLGERGGFISSSDDSSDTYTFNLSNDSVVVCVIYFDVPRCEVDFTSPFAYKYDRFDDYQPFLEGLGDTACPLACVRPDLGTILHTDEEITPFGYLPRFSEYKVSVSRANGAFCSQNGNVDDWGFAYSSPYEVTNINSDLIRYRNREFDRFFSSLSGIGSAYFHVIGSTKVSIAAERNMSYSSDVKLS